MARQFSTLNDQRKHAKRFSWLNITMQLKDRIREAMEAAKLSPAELAVATKKTKAAVTHWLNGDTKSLKADTADRLQTATGYRASWIINGKGEKLAKEQASPDGNVVAGPDIKGKGSYPVISEVQAGNWQEVCEQITAHGHEEWGYSQHDLGHCGYMLRVEGHSMTNTSPDAKLSFPEGMLLHVNPHIDAIPGKYVIVRRASQNAATFKRLSLLDGELYLEAINPDWPNKYIKLEPGDEICGVVVDASYGNLP